MELNPLHQAAEAGDAAAVVAELERGAEIELGTPGYHETALHRAAEHGHLSVVNALIERGCDVNATRRGGFTALHLAATEAVADALLAGGVDPSIRALVRLAPPTHTCLVQPHSCSANGPSTHPPPWRAERLHCHATVLGGCGGPVPHRCLSRPGQDCGCRGCSSTDRARCAEQPFGSAWSDTPVRPRRPGSHPRRRSGGGNPR
eukprot:COSAG02_NODE_3633_length_6447_cov_1546.798362_1_plen_204_part_00